MTALLWLFAGTQHGFHTTWFSQKKKMWKREVSFISAEAPSTLNHENFVILPPTSIITILRHVRWLCLPCDSPTGTFGHIMLLLVPVYKRWAQNSTRIHRCHTETQRMLWIHHLERLQRQVQQLAALSNSAFNSGEIQVYQIWTVLYNQDTLVWLHNKTKNNTKQTTTTHYQ